MRFFDQKFKNKPIVVNCAQNLPYVDDYHVGTVDPSNVDRGESFDSGTIRDQVKWTPRDTVDGDPDMWPTSIKRGNMVTFGPGEISPRAVVWLLPDKFTELNGNIKSHKQLGMVFSQFYQNKYIERALEVVADREPEAIEAIRTATQNGVTDDKIREKVLEYVGDLEKVSQVSNGQGSSSRNQD